MKYDTYQRNHAIIPGREKALDEFLNQGYKGMKHKLRNGFSSHSEDALTWTCFEMLSHLPFTKKISVLDEILQDAYQGKFNSNITFKRKNKLCVCQ